MMTTSPRSRRSVSVLLACASCATATPLAHADEPTPSSTTDAPSIDAQDPRAIARQSYAEGQAHYAAGEFEAAEAAFIRAYQAVPSPIVLIGIAEARYARGLGPEAIQIYERYLRVAPNAPDAAAVRDRVEALRTMPGRVRIATRPEGAEIFLDGQSTGLVTPAVVEVIPGPHEIEVRLVGHVELRGTVDVPIASTRSISGDLEPVADSAFEGPSTEPAPEPVVVEPPDEDLDGRRALETSPLVWSLAATSASLFVAGGVLGFEALSHRNALRPPIDGSTFTPDPRERRTMDREVLASRIVLGGAALTAATAVVTLFVQNRHDDAPVVSVAPVFAPGLAAGTATFRF